MCGGHCNQFRGTEAGNPAYGGGGRKQGDIQGRILREMKELLHIQCPEKKADKLETYLLEYWVQLNKEPEKMFLCRRK